MQEYTDAVIAGFVTVNDTGGDNQRFVRTVSDNMWVSVLHRRTGFGWWEWETAICTHAPRTCNIVMGDRREELASMNEVELMEWYESHKAEKNSMESLLDVLTPTAAPTGGPNE